MNENNKVNEQIKGVKRKSNGWLGQIWSISKRKYKEDWDDRMRLFNTMVKGIVMYSVDIQNWKQQTAIERIKEKYVKCLMKLQRETPAYIFGSVTEVDGMKISA